jgi:hypothetical protein
MNLKSYTLSNINTTKLHNEIAQSNFVVNFFGLVGNESNFSIIGDSLADEAALDLLVTNHNPIAIPESITPRQARQALFLQNPPITSAQIEAAINQLPSPNKELALIEWEFSTAFLRSNPLVNQIGAIFQKTSQEIDEIWILGDSL